MYRYTWFNDTFKKEYLKSFTSFVSYVSKYHNYGKELEEGKYKCPKCYGSGRIVDPNEEPDVIEGHKFSKRISCDNCSGKGYITGKQLKDIYKCEKEIQKIISQEIRKHNKLLASAKKKLTKEEFNAIYRE